MSNKTLQFAIGMVLVAALTGCASNSKNGGLSFYDNAVQKQLQDKRFRVTSVLNRSPRLLIARPQRRSIKKSGSFLNSLMGGLQEKKERDYQTDRSLEHGAESKKSIDLGEMFGSLAGEKKSAEDGEYASIAEEEIILPVISTVYGGRTTIVKAVNGGFGMVLLREGQRKNILACHALFMRMREKSNYEIERAAQGYSSSLMRPTYWLDRRKAPKGEQIAGARSSKKKLVHLSKSEVEQRTASQKSDPTEKAIRCWDRIQNYNFTVSHALIKRLGLFDRPGPFLAAWKDDGRKAMVLDLSMMESKGDFELAIKHWYSLIMTQTNVWRMGTVKSASFRKKMKSFIGKTGDSSILLKSPAKEKGLPN